MQLGHDHAPPLAALLLRRQRSNHLLLLCAGRAQLLPSFRQLPPGRRQLRLQRPPLALRLRLRLHPQHPLSRHARPRRPGLRLRIAHPLRMHLRDLRLLRPRGRALPLQPPLQLRAGPLRRPQRLLQLGGAARPRLQVRQLPAQAPDLGLLLLQQPRDALELGLEAAAEAWRGKALRERKNFL